MKRFCRSLTKKIKKMLKVKNKILCRSNVPICVIDQNDRNAPSSGTRNSGVGFSRSRVAPRLPGVGRGVEARSGLTVDSVKMEGEKCAVPRSRWKRKKRRTSLFPSTTPHLCFEQPFSLFLRTLRSLTVRFRFFFFAMSMTSSLCSVLSSGTVILFVVHYRTGQLFFITGVQSVPVKKNFLSNRIFRTYKKIFSRTFTIKTDS